MKTSLSYGGVTDVPGDVDISIVGFICKGLLRLPLLERAWRVDLLVWIDPRYARRRSGSRLQDAVGVVDGLTTPISVRIPVLVRSAVGIFGVPGGSYISQEKALPK